MTSSANSHQEEGSGGRPLAGADDLQRSWTQTTIFPPDVIQATVRLAYIPETRHAQWQIEVINPVTNELLSMSSVPHCEVRSHSGALSEAFVDLRARWEDLCNPDPF